MTVTHDTLLWLLVEDLFAFPCQVDGTEHPLSPTFITMASMANECQDWSSMGSGKKFLGVKIKILIAWLDFLVEHKIHLAAQECTIFWSSRASKLELVG